MRIEFRRRPNLQSSQRATLAGSGAIYSMTRSASCSNEFGIWMPICSAAFTLITSSNRLGTIGDLVDVGGGTPEHGAILWAELHQTAAADALTELKDRRKFALRHELHDAG